jgi:DNA recombination protein RmuC
MAELAALPEWLYLVLAIVAIASVICLFMFRHVQNRQKMLDEQGQLLAQARGSEQSLQFEKHTLETQIEGLQRELASNKLAADHLIEELKEQREFRLSAEKTSEASSAKYQEQQAQNSEQRAQIDKTQGALEQLQEAYQSLLEKHSRLDASLTERDRSHQKQLQDFSDQKRVLEQEFQNLANKIFEEKGKSFDHTSQASLDKMLKPFREQISEFRQRVDGIHKENNEASGFLKKELEQLRELNQAMTTDARNLTQALKGDKKKVGNWGELQLEKTLQYAGLVEGDHYDSQPSHKNESGKVYRPDFVIKLPGDKHLVIDSKVSLIAYEQAYSAADEQVMQGFLDQHVGAVKDHIDDLASKDYSNLVGVRSPSFVLMFMPIEPAYIEAMKHSKELFNYGYQKGVVMVSHTTLMPILKTVANLWMIERSNKEARELGDRAGDVYNQVCTLAERFQKLGQTMQTANKQYNAAVVALAGQQGLHGKVDRFQKLSSKVTRSIPEIEQIHADIEVDRLEAIAIPELQDKVDVDASNTLEDDQ